MYKSEKQIKYPDIGSVIYKKTKRSKNIAIRLDHTIIRVSIPYFLSFKRAEQFLLSKKKWIENKKAILTDNLSRHKSIDKLSGEIIQEKIFQRVQYFCELYSFTYQKLTIRNQKTRWGSYSLKGNLSLNSQIVYLPQFLMDYVILHELVHSKYMNHQIEFWQELNHYIKNPKLLQKNLRNYGYLLHLK